MSKCENCIHYKACEDWVDNLLERHIFPYECEGDEKPCEFYKDKSLFVELPCKVGQTVWLLELSKVQQARVNEINISLSGNVVVVDLILDSFALNRNRAIYFVQFGKTLFLTKEEAEKKLKEIEGK